MRLRVMHENGDVETLTLVAPLQIVEGQNLDHITDAAGWDHYFTKDGFYDGWGRALPGDVTIYHPEEARDLISKLEAGRVVEKPIKAADAE